MTAPKWTPLDELRAIVRDCLAAGEQPILGMPKADFDAWEDELDSPTVRAAIEYMRGE